MSFTGILYFVKNTVWPGYLEPMKGNFRLHENDIHLEGSNKNNQVSAVT